MAKKVAVWIDYDESYPIFFMDIDGPSYHDSSKSMLTESQVAFIEQAEKDYGKAQEMLRAACGYDKPAKPKW